MADVDSGPPRTIRRAAFGYAAEGHPAQILPNPGSSFSNWENDEPTYCTVRLAKKSRFSITDGRVSPTLAAAWALGAVGRRLPSARPPTTTTFPVRSVDVTEEVSLA